MPNATKPSERSLAEQALANLVDQFARPLDFLRELVQNSIDAGSPRVDVWVDHDPGGEADGVLSIGVDDHGAGMDEATIDGQLLSLYASTKEDDRTKIGKFGIGFTSVFALRPDRVLVRTGRHGTWWELVAGQDRVFQKHKSREPITGTQIILLKRMADDRVDPLVAEMRSVLGYWCEHALVPITFEDRRGATDGEATEADDPFAAFDEAPRSATVNRPMDLDEAWLSHHTTVEMDGLGAVEIVLGYSDSPSYGFYNGGLTLLRTRDDEVLGDYAPRLGHLTFKVRSDRLEHTLTRDNVRRDQAWRRTLDAVARAHVQLRRALLGHVEALAASSEPLGSAHERLADELTIDPGFLPQLAATPLLRDAAGAPCTPQGILDRGEAVVAPAGHPLVSAVHAQGERVIEDGPATRRLLERLQEARTSSTSALAHIAGTTVTPHVRPVEAVWVRGNVVDASRLSTMERRLLARAQALVSVASTPTLGGLPFLGDLALTGSDDDRVQLHLARFVRGDADRGSGALCVAGPADGSLFRRPEPSSGSTSRRSLLVDAEHPTWALHRASAHHDLELAALGLAQAIVHAEGYDRDNPSTGELRRMLAAVDLGMP